MHPRGIMEARELILCKDLLHPPLQKKTPHFSRPAGSVLISVKESNKGTKTTEETIRMDNGLRPKAANKRKTKYSQNPAAIKKRKYQADPTVRKAENSRRNAANALRRESAKKEKNRKEETAGDEYGQDGDRALRLRR